MKTIEDNTFIVTLITLLREKTGKQAYCSGMPVKSNELGITGVCDVVEFIKDKNGVELSGIDGKYLAYPVEYKRGKPKKLDADILQLTAQAICLEEMLLCEVNKGYLFYNEIKHRVEITLTKELKMKVREIVLEMQDYYKRRFTPKVKTGPFCKNCSLQNICLPNLMNKRTVKSYIDRKIAE